LDLGVGTKILVARKSAESLGVTKKDVVGGCLRGGVNVAGTVTCL
jgi:hypothetical protein